VAVLWERGEQYEGGFRHAGYTPNYLKVITHSPTNLSNQILPTELIRINDDHLIGRCR